MLDPVWGAQPRAGGTLMAAKRSSSPFCCRAKAGSCLAGDGGQWMLWNWGRDVGRRAISSSPDRIPEAPDLSPCPQQALEPQPCPSDHPHPQPSRECTPCSWDGLGGSGSSTGAGEVMLSSRILWWGWSEQPGILSKIQESGQCCGPWGRGDGGQKITPQRWFSRPAPAPASRARCASWTWLAASG